MNVDGLVFGLILAGSLELVGKNCLELNCSPSKLTGLEVGVPPHLSKSIYSILQRSLP